MLYNNVISFCLTRKFPFVSSRTCLEEILARLQSIGTECTAVGILPTIKDNMTAFLICIYFLLKDEASTSVVEIFGITLFSLLVTALVVAITFGASYLPGLLYTSSKGPQLTIIYRALRCHNVKMNFHQLLLLALSQVLEC